MSGFIILGEIPGNVTSTDALLKSLINNIEKHKFISVDTKHDMYPFSEAYNLVSDCYYNQINTEHVRT